VRVFFHEAQPQLLRGRVVSHDDALLPRLRWTGPVDSTDAVNNPLP
jgi:hypothetical protein